MKYVYFIVQRVSNTSLLSSHSHDSLNDTEVIVISYQQNLLETHSNLLGKINPLGFLGSCPQRGVPWGELCYKITPCGAKRSFWTIDTAGFCVLWDLDTEEAALMKPNISKVPAEQAHQTTIWNSFLQQRLSSTLCWECFTLCSW